MIIAPSCVLQACLLSYLIMRLAGLFTFILKNIFEKRIINSGITIFDISDHLPIFVNFNLHDPTHQNSKPKFRCMKHF